MDKLALYTRYALRSFVRGRSRSLFGAFCVAAGVASVVALGLAGANFRQAANVDGQKQNRGDVSVQPPGQALTLKQYAIFGQLKAGGSITDYTARLQDDALLRNPRDRSVSTIGTLTAVDPAKFPFYDTITADQPAGTPLARLLPNPESAVISHDTASTLHVSIGGRIAVDSGRGFTRAYTVTGIVPDIANNNSIGFKGVSDFAMVNRSSAVSFFHGLDIGATTVYVKTRDAAQARRVKAELTQRLGGLNSIKTAAEAAQDARANGKGFDQFFHVMGLVAVLIGGIGIINSMLVAARRRTKEIAVLKSLGMKGHQVVFVFTIESLILAVAGTIVGVLLGILASLAVNRVTENLAGNSLPWSLHGQPIVAGILVGLVATVLFSHLPILRASSAKPVAALRQETVGLPKQGRPRMVLLVLGLAAVMGYLAVLYTGLYSGVRMVLYGVIAGIGTLVAAGLLLQLFVLLVWLTSKLPSMGRLSARLAFRSMSTQKRRQGSTLLALCIGILAVGSSAILAQNLKSAFAGAVAGQQKLNVAVQTSHNPAVIRHLNAVVAALPGVEHRDYGAEAAASILSTVDGRNAVRILQRGIQTHKVARDGALNAADAMRGIEGRDTRIAGYALTTTKGRNLGKQDAGTDHMVIRDDMASALGIKVGSRLVFGDGRLRVPFTVVGIFDHQKPTNFTLFADNEADLSYMQRTGLTSPSSSHLSVLYLQIRDDVRSSDIAALRRAFPRSLVLDLKAFLAVVNKAVDNLVLFPEIIAALSLFAGATIIANTVALAMLERRREIGVMKAVGAKRRTILQILLVENVIVGFLGAGMGVLLAMLATVLLDQLSLNITPSFDLATIAGLLLLGIALAIGASALTALPASNEKPMSVLRYE